VLRDLQTAALKNADAFKQANIEVYDSHGALRNMADIIAQLENRLDGASAKQKKLALETLGFKDKSVKYVASLIGVSDKIRTYEAALRDAGGATAEIADKQMTTMEKATSRLGAAWEMLASKMGPVVDVMADYLVMAAKWM